jgi:hypothetical protein
MERYRNLSGDSGVYAFEIGEDYIRVQFEGTGRIYQYSHRKAGAVNVEQMKRLALAGRGLSSYITRNVKSLYD